MEQSDVSAKRCYNQEIQKCLAVNGLNTQRDFNTIMKVKLAAAHAAGIIGQPTEKNPSREINGRLVSNGVLPGQLIY